MLNPTVGIELHDARQSDFTIIAVSRLGYTA